jgi:hypothetical protein
MSVGRIFVRWAFLFFLWREITIKARNNMAHLLRTANRRIKKTIGGNGGGGGHGGGAGHDASAHVYDDRNPDDVDAHLECARQILGAEEAERRARQKAATSLVQGDVSLDHLEELKFENARRKNMVARHQKLLVTSSVGTPTEVDADADNATEMPGMPFSRSPQHARLPPRSASMSDARVESANRPQLNSKNLSSSLVSSRRYGNGGAKFYNSSRLLNLFLNSR